MTVCNMSIECGARGGLIAPDETTYNYIKGKTYAPQQFDAAVEYSNSLRTDTGAGYDREIVIDLDALRPMVTWGTNPGQGAQISETAGSGNAGGDESGRDRALQYAKLARG